MENLNLKERTAIELRYLGNTYKEIADKTDISENTIQGWFADVEGRGKLLSIYKQYVEEMNEKRQKAIEDKIKLSDEEVYVLGTNLVRILQKQVQGRKVPLTDSRGNSIMDKEGNVVMVVERMKVTVKDFIAIVNQQRVMQGLPISVEKQDISAHTTISSDEVVEALGLKGEDFISENYGKTLKRMAEYLREKGIE